MPLETEKVTERRGSPKGDVVQAIFNPLWTSSQKSFSKISLPLLLQSRKCTECISEQPGQDGAGAAVLHTPYPWLSPGLARRAPHPNLQARSLRLQPNRVTGPPEGAGNPF